MPPGVPGRRLAAGGCSDQGACTLTSLAISPPPLFSNPPPCVSLPHINTTHVFNPVRKAAFIIWAIVSVLSNLDFEFQSSALRRVREDGKEKSGANTDRSYCSEGRPGRARLGPWLLWTRRRNREAASGMSRMLAGRCRQSSTETVLSGGEAFAGGFRMKLVPEGCRGAGCQVNTAGENLEKTPFPRHVWTASVSRLLSVDGAHLQPAAREDCAADPSLFTQSRQGNEDVGVGGNDPQQTQVSSR
ncbi:unnamed protein product [Rangifer tarandus platyrhynchus]|uniref:Uncharacterized protein n=3 Tax=Rangifer tarandus platyrhynchus TaxID=3082113 RepID=A0AC59ZXR7_RANTA|nr:unnamed protein product [Rangifer tarandus platyrhynchus]CAI9706796.1 unnamed protein product [Rangifer tarandus platyrhynchus]